LFQQIEKLNQLVEKAKSAEQEIEILLSIASAQFDVNPTVGTHIPVSNWKSCYKSLTRIHTILNANKSIVLPETEEQSKQASGSEEPLSGSLLAFVERLDDELTKSLQFIDPHTQDYVERLQDENLLLELAEKTQKYYSRIQKHKSVARIAIRRMEHIYYKLDRTFLESNQDKKIEKKRFNRPS